MIAHGSAATAAGTAAILLTAALTTQQPPQQQPQPPRFRVEANFVRVDAYVTQGGRPLTDLTRDEFVVLEDGVAQRIETFEHVRTPPPGTSATHAEPTSVRESLDLAIRHRVSVIFLDRAFIGVEGAHRIREPLIRFIDRAFGADDLVGIMTSDMAASQVVLAKKHEVIARELRDYPFFSYPGPSGKDYFDRDDRERAYRICYPVLQFGDLAQRMIDRRRERMTLAALEDLSRYLRHVREERKGVVLISEGWRLYQPDQSLMNLAKYEEPPGVDKIAVGPGGKITRKDPTGMVETPKYECDKDRMALSLLDNRQYLYDVVGAANRSNVSFYAIDPRGLVAPATAAEYSGIRVRRDALETLSGGTDGLAVFTTNDMDTALRRVSDDLSSYYLLGYYSSNTKLDGRLRTIRVRVTRPGVDVRARNGYRAATEAEVAAARAATSEPLDAETEAFNAAFDELARSVRLGDRFRPNTTAGAPRLFRRGPTTGTRYLPAETLVFSRTERLRIEIPVPAGAAAGDGRILDRSRKPLPVPVAVTTRTEAGQSWIVADVALAPLGAGDYLIEVGFAVGGAQQKTITAVRVTR